MIFLVILFTIFFTDKKVNHVWKIYKKKFSSMWDSAKFNSIDKNFYQ